VVEVAEGLPHAVVEQGGQDRAVDRGEAGIAGQITEDRAVVFEKGGPVAALPLLALAGPLALLALCIAHLSLSCGWGSSSDPLGYGIHARKV